jgi:hypothetical protein
MSYDLYKSLLLLIMFDKTTKYKTRAANPAYIRLVSSQNTTHTNISDLGMLYFPGWVNVRSVRTSYSTNSCFLSLFATSTSSVSALSWPSLFPSTSTWILSLN